MLQNSRGSSKKGQMLGQNTVCSSALAADTSANDTSVAAGILAADTWMVCCLPSQALQKYEGSTLPG